MPDDVGVTDAALVEAVAQAVFESWAFYPDASEKPAWYPCGYSTRQDHARIMARAAIAAMQPALDAAREAGRRDGLEQAATTCERKANYIRRMSTYRSRVNMSDKFGASMADDCAKMVRALIPAAPTPTEAADAR